MAPDCGSPKSKPACRRYHCAKTALDYFDTHHTADDTLDKIDPKQLDQAVAVWTAFTYLAAASDVDFRSLASAAK